jgi:hypothetical protein
MEASLASLCATLPAFRKAEWFQGPINPVVVMGCREERRRHRIVGEPRKLRAWRVKVSQHYAMLWRIWLTVAAEAPSRGGSAGFGFPGSWSRHRNSIASDARLAGDARQTCFCPRPRQDHSPRSSRWPTPIASSSIFPRSALPAKSDAPQEAGQGVPLWPR